MLNFISPRGIAVLALSSGLAMGAHAGDFTTTGNLVFNTDVVQYDFRLLAAGEVTLWTDSWRAGLNFDPTLAFFVAGHLTTIGDFSDDTTDPAALLPGQGGYDSQIHFTSLAAGTYRLALTASGNDAIGPSLSDGFSLVGTTPIPIGEWNQPSYDPNKNDQKGSFWELHFNGVDSVSPVPEPGSVSLLLAGLLGMLGIAGVRRKVG